MPGKELAHADALSRLNADTCPTQIDIADLPCGGCAACQLLDAKWRSFQDRVDYVEELSAAPTGPVKPAPARQF